MARQLSPEKRKRFLNSALKLFVENGVANTSTSAIAKDAGTAAGTLFIYFPTKQDLVNALIMNIVKEQSESVNARLHPSLSVREMFFAIWEGTMRWFLENQTAYLFIRQVRDSGMIPQEVVKETEKPFQYYYVATQRGLEEGAIKPYPMELVGNVLYHDIVAVMNILLSGSDPSMQETYINTGFEIFWDGIKAT